MGYSTFIKNVKHTPVTYKGTLDSLEEKLNGLRFDASYEKDMILVEYFCHFVDIDLEESGDGKFVTIELGESGEDGKAYYMAEATLAITRAIAKFTKTPDFEISMECYGERPGDIYKLVANKAAVTEIKATVTFDPSLEKLAAS